MTAQHIVTVNPAADVALTDGESFTVQEGPYEVHCQETEELKQVGVLLLSQLFSQSKYNFRDRHATTIKQSKAQAQAAKIWMQLE